MKVIVCGSAPRVREGAEAPGWTDKEKLFATLDVFDAEHGPLTVIHGDAPGADKLAAEWACVRGRDCRPYPANWSRGRSAGPIRNQRMLDREAPEMVVAFSTSWPPTTGTADMAFKALAAGCRVDVVTPTAYRGRISARDLG